MLVETPRELTVPAALVATHCSSTGPAPEGVKVIAVPVAGDVITPPRIDQRNVEPACAATDAE